MLEIIIRKGVKIEKDVGRDNVFNFSTSLFDHFFDPV